MKWTKEQQNVIDFRNRDILVSAAAGSGKTAVLVARIIQRILDPQNPVDIDRLLVVTFTKAAAAEMRERIGAAIEAECEKDPQNTHLRRQSALIHNAMITTIDSFCLFVVRNHFEEISLDPNFRIADEGEIRLLEQDVLEQVFEDNYARQEKTLFRSSVSGKDVSFTDRCLCRKKKRPRGAGDGGKDLPDVFEQSVAAGVDEKTHRTVSGGTCTGTGADRDA